MMAIATGSSAQHPSSPSAVDETDDGDEETVQVDLRGLMARHPHLFVDASSMGQATTVARAVRELAQEQTGPDSAPRSSIRTPPHETDACGKGASLREESRSRRPPRPGA
jgi:hypothetical protein